MSSAIGPNGAAQLALCNVSLGGAGYLDPGRLIYHRLKTNPVITGRLPPWWCLTVRDGAAVETLSELLNNAAEHGMSDTVAHWHVRVTPRRPGECLDMVVADSGPGIRATLAQNPNLPATQSDREAITLAIRELTSGTATWAPSLTGATDRTGPDAPTGYRGKANSTRSQPRNRRPTRCAAVSVE